MQSETYLSNKVRIHAGLCRLAGGTTDEIAAALVDLYHPAAQWRGSHPLNEISGTQAIETHVWAPLLTAFPDLERRDLIVAAGSFEGRDYIAAVGHFCGTFSNSWLTIPASGRTVFIRYCEVHQVRDGLIVQSNCLWDVLDVMRQAGFWPIAPSLGSEGLWPGPITGDGLLLSESDPQVSEASLRQALALNQTLGNYNDALGLGRDGLLSMPQRLLWHPKMGWYGPSGIGTTHGLTGFVDCHQLPFRTAFPNRKGGSSYVRIGDGPFSVTGGWPGVKAIHLGDNFLGVGPTGRAVTMRIMEFCLHHEGLIRENWVAIDLLDLLLQMGVDVFGRIQNFFRR